MRDSAGFEAAPVRTVGAWMIHHFAELEATGSRSVDAYRKRWLRFCAPLHRLPLAELDARAVVGWLQWMATERTIFGTAPSPNYVRATFGVVNCAMLAAVIAGHLRSNPCTGLRRYLPKRIVKAKGKRRVVQHDEAAALLTTREVPFYVRSMYAAAIYAGLRPGEVCGLQFRDLRLLAPVPFMHVRRSWDERTKTFSSERDVPIHPEFMEFFLAPLVNHEWPTRVKRAWRPTDHPFGTRRGTAYRTRRLSHALDEHFCRIGIFDGCTFHGLRHTCATFWSDADLDEGAISAMLGHAPSQTDHYARPSMARLGREIRKFSLLRAQTVDSGSGVDIPLTTPTRTEVPIMPEATRSRSSCSSALPTPEQATPRGDAPRAKALPRSGDHVVEWQNPIRMPALADVREELLPPGARALGATVAAGLALADVTDRLDAAAAAQPPNPTALAALVEEHARALSTYRSTRGGRSVG